MRNSFYFDHDYNAKGDEKILDLRAEFGVEGYGLYFMLLESMAESTDGYLRGGAMGGLSLCYGVDTAKLTKVVDFCVEAGLLDRKDEGVYSERMMEHKKRREALSEAGKKGAKAKWENRGAKATPMQRKGKESKVKERKGKKHIYGENKNVLLSDVELQKLKEQFPDWEEKIKAMDEAIEMKGYKYKSHYLAILKWSRDGAGKSMTYIRP